MTGGRDRDTAVWPGGQAGARLPVDEAGRAPWAGPDRALVTVVLLLTALGTVMVFSAGAALAAKIHGDALFFLKREAVYVAIGLGTFSLALRIDYALYRRLAYPLLAVSLGLLLLVLAVGTETNGAIRWFRWGGLSFQPSELAKFALVAYLAMLLARKAEKVREFSIGFLPPLVMTGLFLGLLLMQPDLGTAVIMGATTLALLFIAGTRTSYILLAVLAAAPLAWKVLVMDTPWRMRRLLAFVDPWQFRRDSGYQLVESLISFGAGGLTGQGLGGSRQKLMFLPEAHTDFILAIIGEELGFVGVVAVLAAFALLVWRGFSAGFRARDAFGRCLAFGITLLFGLQALINMGVVLGLLPTKGLALPFVSYGGSALVTSLFMAGVLANISARNPERRAPAMFHVFRRRPDRGRNRRAEPRVEVVVEPRRAARSPLRV